MDVVWVVLSPIFRLGYGIIASQMGNSGLGRARCFRFATQKRQENPLKNRLMSSLYHIFISNAIACIDKGLQIKTSSN